MLARLLILLALAIAGSGCTTSMGNYLEARDGFDSVTGYDEGPDEPARFEFAATARRWPWFVRFTGGTGIGWVIAKMVGRPHRMPVENPSEFARDNLEWMRRYGGTTLGQIAETAVRALWIVDNDPQPLDQMVAIGVVEEVLDYLQVDPLRIAPPKRGGDAEAQAIDADLRTLDRLAPWTRGGRPPTALERDLAVAAIGRSTATPHSSASVGRRLIRFLLRAANDERDPVLRAALERGLVDTLANETAWSLLWRVQVTQSDDVRSTAITSLVRRCGPAGVRWIVATLARFELSPAIRRQLVRLCAALPPDQVDVASERGPSPVVFLYDLVKRRDAARRNENERGFWTDEEDAVSGLALEALALCLSRDIDHDSAWADRWWNERALGGERR
ncbi:MAG: hypothetical protein U1F36_07270 [Planctomycetota bacterium]